MTKLRQIHDKEQEKLTEPEVLNLVKPITDIRVRASFIESLFKIAAHENIPTRKVYATIGKVDAYSE